MYRIGFRLCTPEDLPLLERWLAAPHVARWWEPEGSVEEEYLPLLEGRDSTRLFAIELDGVPIGIVQLALVWDDEEWAAYQGVLDLRNTAGIDFLIGEEALTGRGIGTQAIRDFAAFVFARHPDVHAILADPEQENVPSWRAQEKAGYTRIWSGEVEGGSGPSYLYRHARPAPSHGADM
jgi:aminoglycoside 6'-N-acetyltransferase